MALVNPHFEMTPLVCVANRRMSESAVRLPPHSEPTAWGWVQGLLTCLNFEPRFQSSASCGEEGREWGRGGWRVQPQTQKKMLWLETRPSVDGTAIIIPPWSASHGVSGQLLWDAKPPVGFGPGTPFWGEESSTHAEGVRTAGVGHSDDGTAQLLICLPAETWSPPSVFASISVGA